MPITALPSPPSRQDPTNFNDRADAFLGALPQFQSEANALESNVNDREQSTVAASNTALAIVNITKWASGTTYANGAVVWSPINGLAYRRITTSGSGTTDPSSDTTNYVQISGTGNVSTTGTQSIGGAKTFTSNIIGNLTGNASTATNASTVTNGVYTVGNQTIAGSKTFSSPIIFPDLTTQGSAAAKVVRAVFVTTSQTYTRPAGCNAIAFFVSGATGGLNMGQSRGGIGGAGYSEKYISSPSASYVITIGAAGTTSGTAGGTTSVDTISITGSGGVTSQTGSAGGVASGGTFNANGGSGGNAIVNGAGGGGGAGGSRAGNGFAGGSKTSYTQGGAGGGGTGGVGAADGLSYSGGAGGVAATVNNASAITLTPYWPPAASLSQFSAGIKGDDGDESYYGAGGNGANGSSPSGIYGLLQQGGIGGRGGQSFSFSNSPRQGDSGIVQIWEFYL